MGELLKIKCRLMNGPIEGQTFHIQTRNKNLYIGNVWPIQGHNYWIKPETLTDGTFKAWYVTDEVEQ